MSAGRQSNLLMSVAGRPLRPSPLTSKLVPSLRPLALMLIGALREACLYVADADDQQLARDEAAALVTQMLESFTREVQPRAPADSASPLLIGAVTVPVRRRLCVARRGTTRSERTAVHPVGTPEAHRPDRPAQRQRERSPCRRRQLHRDSGGPAMHGGYVVGDTNNCRYLGG